ncbi:plasmid fertility inhibition factor family protein [Massilia sp. CMS3.1]|uniref:plasmid fertility inhibition factor family protein n=1 Tax=Massilia sp. CMS3.1 TaxID=3373083 RepID=UPI003EE64971
MPNDIATALRKGRLSRSTRAFPSSLALTSQLPQRYAAGSPSIWIRDRKYGWAGYGFARGSENPVPLAKVECGLADRELTQRRRCILIFSERLFVAFERTSLVSVFQWRGPNMAVTLGAAVSPVECPVSDATRLHELAKICGGGPVQIADLVS